MSQDAGAHWGGLLRAHRTRARLTQEQLAERAGLGVRTLRDYEGGRVARPHRESLRLLTRALELSAEQRAELSRASGVEVPPAARPPGPARPCLLPPAIADFCGRADALRAGTDALTGGGRALGSAATLVLTGSAGMGKTTLGVRLAHELRPRYADGQLYADLRSADTHPLGPAPVLGVFLRALGVPDAQVPGGLEQRAAAYRARLADRSVLVVLDNVTDESQVRPLQPAAGCALLVTSRARLSGLAGATVLVLDGLPDDEAVELLTRAAGRAVLADELPAARRVVAACERVPLAVRIAGARLAARPHWPLERLADLLDDRVRRLDELAVGDLDMRASLDLSYRALTSEQRRCLRLLGLLEAPDVPGWAAAALLDVGAGEADRLVEALVDAQLLQVRQEAGRPVRYRFHDLVRAFARDRAQREDPEDVRLEALVRALAGWLVRAQAADRALPSRSFVLDAPAPAPDGDLLEGLDARTWFAVEREAVLAAVLQAAGLGLADTTWRLTSAVGGFLLVRSLRDEWAAALQASRSACAEAGDVRGWAVSLYGLAELHVEFDRLPEAEALLDEAAGLFTRVGDLHGRAWTEYSRGYLHRQHGRLPQARTSYRRALDVFRAVGDRAGAARATYGLGVVHRQLGQHEQAAACLSAALADARSTGDQRLVGQALRSLGILHESAGSLREAQVHLHSAAAVMEDVGDDRGRAHVLSSLAHLALRQGEADRAQEQLQRALAEFRRLGEPIGEATALQTLGELLSRRRPEQAAPVLLQSLEIWQDLDVPRGAAACLRALAELDEARGDRSAAARGWSAALHHLERSGDPAADEVRAKLRCR